ncbi:hypothetical protein KZP23_14555 [Echinicola marina]|uniref:hypothetical protein n=1 Tax=Echinicola marina TaxID=2859768 RepID=UPI001CF67E08|nr:hypothetical protein [Echinicola marina]UCS91944.1 hypothetical protein KZP23_14555 [Echinicola marina]
MPKNIEFSFRLVGIDTQQFALLQDNFSNGGEIGLDLGVPIHADDEHHRISVVIEGRFICNDKPFMIFKVMCEFEIHPEAFQTLISKKSKKEFLKIPVGLCRHLATIAVGTTRGVLHERLAKTPFNNFILPTVDLTKILTDDLVLVKGARKMKEMN